MGPKSGRYIWLSRIICPFYLLGQLWRRRRGLLRERWHPRFDLPSERSRIWLHTLSVGELQAAGALMEGLARRFPHYELVLTVATASGFKTARQRLGKRFRVYPAPLHCPGALKRYVSAIDPRLFILVESDLWPDMIGFLRIRGVPLILANAALSGRSLSRLKRFRFLTRLLYEPFSVIVAASEEDRQRIETLNPGPSVLYLGNLKYDFPPPEKEEIERLREILAPCLRSPVIVCGSTHPGEETLLLEAFRKFSRGTLILCPRHPERAGEVKARAEAMGLRVALRSRPAPAEVLVIDTLGELRALYGLADLAFVGGTLVPVGGHNLLEPASLGVPVVFGPHLESVSSVARELERAGGGLRVEARPEALLKAWEKVLLEARIRGRAAHRVYGQHRGAVERYLALLANYL